MLSDIRPFFDHSRHRLTVADQSAPLDVLAFSGTEALSDFGLMSFTALSQLAPAVLLAVYRPRTPSPAIIAGIVLGSLVWLWLVLLPMVIPAATPSVGADGLHWLSVVSLRVQPGHIAISMGASLAVNLVTVVLVSRAVRPSLPRQRDAVAAASMRNMPSTTEYSVWVRRWTKDMRAF